MRNEGWVPVEEAPEVEDCYIVAWLPEGLKRAECFYAIVEYAGGEWDMSDLDKIMEYWRRANHDSAEIYAWRPLPNPYIREL